MVNIRKGFKLTPTDKDKRIAELEQENKVLAQNLEDIELNVMLSHGVKYLRMKIRSKLCLRKKQKNTL